METLSKIIVTNRGHDFHAALNGDTRLWGCGKTPDVAIGDALRTHADRFGIFIESINPHSSLVIR